MTQSELEGDEELEIFENFEGGTAGDLAGGGFWAGGSYGAPRWPGGPLFTEYGFSDTAFKAFRGGDTIFTDDIPAHSGTLSITEKIPPNFTGPRFYPFLDYDGVTDEHPANGYFWFRYTGTLPGYHSDPGSYGPGVVQNYGIFDLITTAAVGDNYWNDGLLVVTLFTNGVGTGWHLHYNPSEAISYLNGVPNASTVDIELPLDEYPDTWLKVSWSWVEGMFSMAITDDNGLLIWEMTEPVFGAAFGFPEFSLNNGSNHSTDWQNWFDDVYVRWGEPLEIIEPLPVLTVGLEGVNTRFT